MLRCDHAVHLQHQTSAMTSIGLKTTGLPGNWTLWDNRNHEGAGGLLCVSHLADRARCRPRQSCSVVAFGSCHKTENASFACKHPRDANGIIRAERSCSPERADEV